MGEIVAAGLLAHVPTIMLPETSRRALNGGHDFTLVEGLHRIREEVLARLDYDLVVVFDSHWHTTVEFVIAAQARRQGLYTSDELPRGMRQVPYDFRGDPEFARAVAGNAEAHGTWITAIDDPCLPIHYATVNLLSYLHRGREAWVSVGCCQTADGEDYRRVGRAIGAALAALDRRAVLIASGALSHRFWPLRELRRHESAGIEHIASPEAAAADRARIAWFEAGDHARILETMPEFLRFKPEANFGHYLMMAGALGEERLRAPARMFSAYENAIGTGQVHLWFDRPASGWRGERTGIR